MSLEKADPQLKKTLKGSPPGKIVRAILTLADMEDNASKGPAATLDKVSFGEREDYRAALIDKQKGLISRQNEETIQNLEKLGLSLFGGSISRAIVVEGPVEKVKSSLNLSGVVSASFDRLVIAVPRSMDGAIGPGHEPAIGVGRTSAITPRRGSALAVKDLIDAGVHYGHRASRWNPKMKPYIYGKRNLIHIIDLKETVRGLLRAIKFFNRVAAANGLILFVGTKRQAAETIIEQCSRSGMPYVTERWLGGTLANFRTIRSRLIGWRSWKRSWTESKHSGTPRR